MSINKLVRGYKYLLYAKIGATYTHIAYLSDFSVNETLEVEEINSKDNGNVKVVVGTVFDFEVTTNAYINTDTARTGAFNPLRNLFVSGQEFQMVVAPLLDAKIPDSTNMNTDIAMTAANIDVTGIGVYTGKALITSLSHTYATKDIATYSMTMNGTTQLVRQTTLPA